MFKFDDDEQESLVTGMMAYGIMLARILTTPTTPHPVEAWGAAEKFINEGRDRGQIAEKDEPDADE